MRIASAVVAIVIGLLVLIGYFVPVENLVQLRLILVQWANIMVAVAILVGVMNLFGVHWKKISTRQKNGVYSILLIFSLFFTAVLGIVGADSPVLNFVLDAIIVPAEVTLMALLAVTLIYARARLLRRRVDVMSLIFLVFAIITLLLTMPLPFGKIPGADFVRGLITNFFALAGARGILIGVTLGALTTGLRVLFGIDRPYGGN